MDRLSHGVKHHSRRTMQIRHYRLNRKDGILYREVGDVLEPVGDSLRVILLHATATFYAKLFDHMPPQHWVQLCFLDPEGNWSYALLNDGTTRALRPWLLFRQWLDTQPQSGRGSIATLGFEAVDARCQWYDYRFSGKPGKPGLASRVEALLESPPFPLVTVGGKRMQN